MRVQAPRCRPWLATLLAGWQLRGARCHWFGPTQPTPTHNHTHTLATYHPRTPCTRSCLTRGAPPFCSTRVSISEHLVTEHPQMLEAVLSMSEADVFEVGPAAAPAALPGPGWGE